MQATVEKKQPKAGVTREAVFAKLRVGSHARG